jgi:cytochrome c oxidase subunit 3
MSTCAPVLDVSKLPSTVFGSRSILWMATMCLVLIEGTMFSILVATYFYLRTRTSDWPPGLDPPDLLWGTLSLGIFLVSLAPNMLIKKAASERRLGAVKLLLVVMTLVPLIVGVVRTYEFLHLNCNWASNAYGSVVWTLLGMHTVHLITDWYDTAVLCALLFFGPYEEKRLMDVAENADYWYFVIGSWAFIYIIIYWAPRWL